jgi:hypothetical protein
MKRKREKKTPNSNSSAPKLCTCQEVVKSFSFDFPPSQIVEQALTQFPGKTKTIYLSNLGRAETTKGKG